MKLTLECSREKDGRWLAQVPQFDGMLAYGDTKAAVITKVQALTLRMLAAQLEAGSCAPGDISMSIVDLSNEDDAGPAASAPADQAAYDAWLTAEVRQALDDDSPTISTEEVMRYVRAGMCAK